MKNSILFFFIFIGVTTAQKRQINEITYQQANDIQFFKNIKNGTRTNSYVFEDGNRISVGDTLTLGTPSSGSSTSRALGGGTNNIGAAAVSTRQTKEYEFLIYGKPAGVGSIVAAMNGQAPSRVNVRFRGRKVLVNEIILSHKGSKKKPLNAQVRIGEINGRAFGINKFLTVTDLDLAFSFEEVVIGNMKMTRAQAIEKLKESKELLELELLTEEEYQEIKIELTPIIRNKQ